MPRASRLVLREAPGAGKVSQSVSRGEMGRAVGERQDGDTAVDGDFRDKGKKRGVG